MTDRKVTVNETDPRDVLADRIQTWADTEDWHVYDYADRLLNDLDAAGFEVVAKPHDPEQPSQERGASLMLGVFVPEADEEDDPDTLADGLIAAINNLRKREGGTRLMIALWPTPQWFTKDTMTVLRRASDLVNEERTDD